MSTEPNKIDLAKNEPDKVRANRELIERKMRVKSIPISAQTREGLDKLASAIHHNLPLDTSKVLGETVDESLKKLVRYRQIDVDSVVSAIKTVSLIDKNNRVTDFIQFAAHVLGLYGYIVSQYRASDLELAQADIDIAGLWRSVDSRMSETPSSARRTAPLVAVGITFGAVVATVATGGLAAIPIAIGVGGGLGVGGAVGITSSMLHRSQTFEGAIRSEMEKRVSFTHSMHRFETAASVLAFGRALRECCEQIERKNESEKFPKVFDREFNRALRELEPFKERISTGKKDEEEYLIRDIIANSFKMRVD